MQGRLFINGSWTGEELASFEIRNPANGETVGTAVLGGREEAALAVEAAHEAFPAWSALTAGERSGALRRLYGLMISHKEELARTITLEMGKPIRESRGEVEYAASFIEWYAEQAKRVYGETVPSSHPDKRILVVKQPIGVVAAITPWNFPAAMVTRKLGPALAAGCTVVLKPSGMGALTAVKLVQLCEEAGFPRGVVNLVTGNSKEIGDAVMSDPRVAKVTFTGSTEVGKQLMRQGADGLKKLSLELGGHAPMIVLDDADLEKAVQGVMASKFRNAGQTCICGNRIYVQRGCYDVFVERLADAVRRLRVGNGIEEQTDIGPLVNTSAYEKVQRHVSDAIGKGAVLIAGGEGRSEDGCCYYTPTLLGHADASMLVMQEETFGPVAPIQVFDSDEEAAALANDSSYGLAAYLFTESLSRGTRIMEALQYGIIGWNDGAPSVAQAPFGGLKESGMGKEGGHQGLDAYLDTKYVSIGLR